MKRKGLFGLLFVFMIAGELVGMAQTPTCPGSSVFKPGDVFVSFTKADPKTGKLVGTVTEFKPTGEFVRTLNTTVGGYTTGMAFDSAQNLYVTNFLATSPQLPSVSKFDCTGTLVNPSFIITAPATPNGQAPQPNPESIVLTAPTPLAPNGYAFVGGQSPILNSNPPRGTIQQFDLATGNLLNTLTVKGGDASGGTDWIDFLDPNTIIYDGQGTTIPEYFPPSSTSLFPIQGTQASSDFANVSTLPPLCTTQLFPPAYYIYALRVIPDTVKDKSLAGDVLVAASIGVLLFNHSGVLVRSYALPGLDPCDPLASAFAINLDPNGTDFWTADSFSGHVWEVNFAKNANNETVIDQQWSIGQLNPGDQFGGLAVLGELTTSNGAAPPPELPTLTITASSGSFTYGGTPPTITPSYDGFVNGDTPASLTTQPTCSTTATSASTVSGNPYPSSCSGAASANYLIAYVNGAVNVQQAGLTITASSGSFTYGGTPPTITASYDGFVNGDKAANLTTQPTCSTTATSASSVSGNPYPSSCSGAASANYLIAYVNGAVNVQQAGLTITASSGSFTYGGTPPTITPSYDGFVNGDTPASLTTQPTCSTTATSASSVSGSPYPSSCSGAASPDYSISYVNGAVNVQQPTQTGTLVVKKTIIGGTGTFHFTSPGLSPASFEISTSGGTETFTNVLPGLYTITEAAQAGWMQSASSCSVTVVAGGSVNCDFTNTFIGLPPGLSLQKTANPTTYTKVGDVITYTYTLANTGQVPLTGPLTVTDDKLGTFTCSTATLAVGASVSCTRTYAIKASDLVSKSNLPTKVVANINTGAWLQGVLSTQDTMISGAGPAVPNGIYPAWCIEAQVPNDLHNQPATLYSTIGGGLPADVAILPWNEVNYLLNHKTRTNNETTLQFFEDVQTAIWLLIGDTNTEFPVTANANNMINEAKLHPTFVPGPGDIVAVIIYSDGIQHPPKPGSIQESIFEMKEQETSSGSIVNHATGSGQFGSAVVQSLEVQATVTQLPVLVSGGPYPIICSGASSANYSTAYDKGAVSVTDCIGNGGGAPPPPAPMHPDYRGNDRPGDDRPAPRRGEVEKKQDVDHARVDETRNQKDNVDGGKYDPKDKNDAKDDRNKNVSKDNYEDKNQNKVESASKETTSKKR